LTDALLRLFVELTGSADPATDLNQRLYLLYLRCNPALNRSSRVTFGQENLLTSHERAGRRWRAPTLRAAALAGSRRRGTPAPRPRAGAKSGH
jgi:hypothetical protein